MRILVYGAGAVGGYFGGRLAEAGAEVTLLARGTQLDALRAHGLTLNSIDGDWSGKLPTVAAADQAPAPDLVLLCVKGHDTGAAAADLARVLPPHGQVVSLQNGIDNVRVLEQALGPGRVIAATVFIGARVTSPGVIRHTAAGFMRAGRYPDGSSPEVTRAVEFLALHGVKAALSSDIRRDMWKKLLWNVGFNGPSALTGATVGEMLETPGISWLIRGLIAEAVAVGRASGVALNDDLVDKTFAQTQNLGRFKTSMLQDVEAGRRIENGPFYGFLLREGETHGVDTPLIRMTHDALELAF